MTITSHLTLDLETLSTDPSALILSIGASVFHVDDGENQLYRNLPCYDSFYCEINKKDQVEVFHRDVSQSTLDWWSKQSGNARRVLIDSPEKVLLPEGLNLFSDWIVGLETEVVVWGNGCAFDNAIIRSACATCNLEYPWSYRRDGCYRTLMMNPTLLFNHEELSEVKEQEGWQAHIAVDDAAYEGWVLRHSYPVEYFIGVSNKLSK